MDVLEQAERYVRNYGWSVIPVPYRQKRPTIKAWQNCRLSIADLPMHFNGTRSNIGVLNGEPSGGLIDIDLDSPIAILLAPFFLPDTLIFGRKSSQRSHYLYRVVEGGLPSTTQFEDPSGEMLLEQRSTGSQTIIPPSEHPSGERIEFATSVAPTAIAGEELKRVVSRLAVATLFCREWPTVPGTRQNCALALAGVLLRSGFSIEEAEGFIFEVAAGGGDEQAIARKDVVAPTARKLQNGSPTWGWPRLAELFGEGVAAKATRWLGGRTQSNGDKKRIPLTDRFPHEVEGDLITVITELNQNPVLFYRDGKLVQIAIDEDSRPKIVELSEAMLDGILTRRVECFTRSGKGEKTAEIPPRHIKRLLVNPDLPCSPLDAITEIPVLRVDGSILDQPGYDEPTRLYYLAPPETAVSIPDHPTLENVQEAVATFTEPLQDFPFADDASKANTIGLFISVFVECLLSGGRPPLSTIDSPEQGTGKTLLVEVLAIIATGRRAATVSLPESEAEFRKQITSILRTGPSLVIIDNCKGALSSAALERCLTSSIWSDRILGRSEQIELPNRATWIATGNNVTVSGDLVRRTYPIRLDAGTRRPWMNRTFAIKDLPGWTLLNRNRLVGAALTIIRAWIQAGKPVPEDAFVIGGFEAWSRTVAGILQFAGVNGFLSNQTDFYEDCDGEDAEWASLLQAIHNYTEGAPFYSKDVANALAGGSQSEKTEAIATGLPERVRDRLDQNKSISSSLGNLFKSHRDRRFGPEAWSIVVHDKVKNATRWKIVCGDVDGGMDGQASQNTDSPEIVVSEPELAFG